MRTRKFHVYNDPGHGWCKVPVKFLEELGVMDEITPYSYLLGEHAYLEEDQDASTFVRALEAKGIPFTWVSHHTNRRSRIRDYPAFSRQMVENMRKVPVEGMVIDYYGNKYQLMKQVGNRWHVRNSEYGSGYWMTLRQVAEACVVYNPNGEETGP
jgi:hypothetical protein